MSQGAEKLGARRDDDLRCPYCRGGVQAEADQQPVVCSACSAPLHAECAVEARGCPACRGAGFLVGEATGLDLAGLTEAIKDPARLERLARPQRWRKVARLLLHVLRLLALVAGLLVGLGNDAVTGLLVAGCGLIAVTGVSAFVFPPRRLRRAKASEWRDVTMLLPQDPGQALADQLRNAGIPDPEYPAGPHPERCPACGTSLEAWFCHECGASAVPEGGEKGKGDDEKQAPPERERA